MQTLESHAMNESYTKKPIDTDELMTTKETAEFLRVNRATLWSRRRFIQGEMKCSPPDRLP